jgi:dTDP-4-dehydrorhamnose reductase
MKILVTGANGQLGSELREISRKFSQYEFIYTDEKELDITDESQLNEFFTINHPDVVINCAAYTAVDKAESEEKMAFLINSTAAGYLSSVSAKYRALLIHISTDYVFDGKAFLPYIETSGTSPISAYGRSKSAGELAIHQYATNALIIRTSWLYSEFGNNFVKSIIKYAKERGTLHVVYDQIGTPTHARDLAKTILEIIPSAVKSTGIEIYHYSNEGVASWYDFAKAIIEFSGAACKINPILSKDYPQVAIRPLYSVLDKSKIKERFSIDIPYWRDSLKDCVIRLNE